MSAKFDEGVCRFNHRLSEKSALIVLDEPLEPLTNLKMNLGEIGRAILSYRFQEGITIVRNLNIFFREGIEK